MGAELMSAMARTDTILLGRVSYQEWAAYWPTAITGQEGVSGRAPNADVDLDRQVFVDILMDCLRRYT